MKNKPAISVLVADDEKTVCWAAERALTGAGYMVKTVNDGISAVTTLEKGGVDILVLDLRMPGLNGLEVLKKAKEISPDTFVIVISAFGDMSTTIEAMKLGAYDFIPKPFNIEKLCEVVGRAAENSILNKEATKTEINDEWSLNATPILHGQNPVDIVGQSPKMQEIYKLIGRIAKSDVTVLISGESGSGKELIARALHASSLRANKPFLAVNCTAIPANLIESEFFGHEKGSFTGAHIKKSGKFELANGGTLFLDEIGDMSQDMQSKLLRVLQEKEFVRVGGTKEIKTDVRIIAATNMDLEKAIITNKFREDLYHRLKVIIIDMPPLRERPEDIEPLANSFLKSFAQASDGAPKTLSAEALKLLKQHHWPGNVRELKNTIESATAICLDPIITPEYLSIELKNGNGESVVQRVDTSLNIAINKLIDEEISPNCTNLYEIIIGKVEGILLQRIMELSGGNQLKAAKLLGINRNTLRTKLNKAENNNKNL